MESFELGSGWLIPYYNSEFRLRFELGGEIYWQVTHVVPRFIQALDRSRALADAVFEGSHTIAIVGYWKIQSRELFHRKYKRGATGLSILQEMGFSDVPQLSEWREKPIWTDPDDPEDGVPFDWKSYNLTGRKEMRDTLLWASNAYEIGIEPKAPVVVSLYNPKSNIVFYIYDDRGMDITALDPSTLMPIYNKFNSWLLDYDRPRIESTFGPVDI